MKKTFEAALVLALSTLVWSSPARAQNDPTATTPGQLEESGASPGEQPLKEEEAHDPATPPEGATPAPAPAAMDDKAAAATEQEQAEADPKQAQRTSPRVLHAPFASTPADEPRRVLANITGAYRLAETVLRYRRQGEAKWRGAIFQRAEGGGWAAVIPAGDLSAGVLEYYIASRLAGSPADAPEILHFASPAQPQAVEIVGDDEARWRRALLAMHLGNHSRFQLTSEYADFGTRALKDGTNLRDYFYRVEGDYTYRILGWAYSIRIGAGLLKGDTWKPDDVDPALRAPVGHNVGLKYGFAELRFRFGRLVRFDLRATLGAGPEHFDGGAGAQLLIGHDPGTHFALGVDGVSSIGFRSWLRLAWNTVPRVPMSFTIEALNFPDDRTVGGRVLLGAGYRFHRHFSVTGQLGYGTRDFRIGGLQAGLNAALEF